MFKIIQYGANFCSQCKLQKKEYTTNPLKEMFEYLDVEDIPMEETKLLNIHTIPVTILYSTSENPFKEIKRWVGYTKSEEINNFIKTLDNE